MTYFGYEVFEASDGIEAVDVAFKEFPDLILLDFLMPHSDGVEVVKHLRGNVALANTVIVLYTAAVTHAERLHAVEGVQRVLFKPLETARLIRTIRELIGGPETEPIP